MLNKDIETIIAKAQTTGWILEPDAKRLLDLAGLPVPRFYWVDTLPNAIEAAESVNYPVVAKVVSPNIIHKSEVQGVVVGIENADHMTVTYNYFSGLDGFCGILVEEMVPGIELIVGAKIDHQFGPVILMGIGGTSVEIYHDTALRMAPLIEKDVASMIESLKGVELLKGYRAAEPINMGALSQLMVNFSNLVMAIDTRFESIDLNPVKCTAKGCIVADARIML
jgi:succinyl-CoA synthetase beta subunit